MSKWFMAHRFLRDAHLSQEGEIRVVSRNWFASGVDVVSCGPFAIRGALNVGNVKGLHNGDVVKVFSDGRILRLWDVQSLHNCIFVTGACNFRCWMCPQPPVADNPLQHQENLKILNLLKTRQVKVLGITGGEPVLFPSRLVEYYDVINRKFPAARVEVLTNGSLFSDFDRAKQLSLAAPYDICYCISLHGDTADLAESVMRTPGGWDKAVQGVMNLARLQQEIELRLVMTKHNVRYLKDIALFFYRNFPFVAHIAFMGQEIIGTAECNFKEVWVEPQEYAQDLANAVLFLSSVGMNVSIYNLPLCLLPEQVWRFAAKSISDWKQGYRPQCENCRVKSSCCGFFTTSRDFVPKGIGKIKRTRI